MKNKPQVGQVWIYEHPTHTPDHTIRETVTIIAISKDGETIKNGTSSEYVNTEITTRWLLENCKLDERF